MNPSTQPVRTVQLLFLALLVSAMAVVAPFVLTMIMSLVTLPLYAALTLAWALTLASFARGPRRKIAVFGLGGLHGLALAFLAVSSVAMHTMMLAPRVLHGNNPIPYFVGALASAAALSHAIPVVLGPQEHTPRVRRLLAFAVPVFALVAVLLTAPFGMFFTGTDH